MQSHLITAPNGQLTIGQTPQFTGILAANLLPEINLLTLSPLKDSLGIAEVKRAIVWMKTLRPDKSGKVLLITQADLLTSEAQNALLKLLEEPGENNHILLVSTNPEVLLPTITSRCQLTLMSPNSPTLNSISPKHQQLFSLIFNQSFIQSWIAVDQAGITKDKSTARTFLLDMITYLKLNQNNQAKALHQILATIDLIDHNVNLKLAIETLLLDLLPTH